jgi:ketosteroid isomerase-like protein
VPSEEVEIVRRGYEAYERGASREFSSCSIPRSSGETPPDSPIAGVFQGHEGVREWQRQAEEAWDEIKFTPEEIVDAPDGRVLAICTGRIRG